MRIIEESAKKGKSRQIQTTQTSISPGMLLDSVLKICLKDASTRSSKCELSLQGINVGSWVKSVHQCDSHFVSV